MWPPHSVKTWPTPACLSTRATSSPPLRSATRPLHGGAELLQPSQLVEEAPLLGHLAARHAIDRDLRHGDLAAGRRQSGQPAEFTEVRAGGGVARHDRVALADHGLDALVPVGERRLGAPGALACAVAAAPIGQVRARRKVADEVL